MFKNMTYDVTKTSLPKTIGKFGPPQNQTNYISKYIYKIYIQLARSQNMCTTLIQTLLRKIEQVCEILLIS